MKKLAENIVLKSQGDSRVQFIQTSNDYTYIEEISLSETVPEMYVCVNTEKFLAVFNEQSSQLIPESDYLIIKNNRSTVKLPYMKNYGVFNVSKGVDVPSDTEPSEKFCIDFSTVSLDTVDALDQFSYILFNRDFVCRYLYNTLTFYGKLTGDYYNITPKQFKVLRSLGECEISVYGEGLISVKKDNITVNARLYQSVINLKMLDRFFNNSSVCSLHIEELDIKKLKLFSKESDEAQFKILKNGTMTVETLGYFEEYRIECQTDQDEIILKVFSKDFEHLQGSVDVYFMSGNKYLITHPEENKTVLFLCS